jgi:outer membrane protein assembly factor BamB
VKRRFFIAAWLAAVPLFACNYLLGTEAADPNGSVPDAIVPDGPSGPNAAEDAGTTTPTVDAAFAPVECGDGSKLRAGAPWATGGACNTRISRAAVPPLQKPKIKWRFNVPGGAGPLNEFMSGPAVGEDGAIYATHAQIGEAGRVEYSLVCVHDGKLRFKTPLPDGFNVPGAVPTLAADGRIYASTPQGLSAFDSNGGILWTYPTSRTSAASPVVLNDGTVVVSGLVLSAVHTDGTKRWELPPVGTTFVGSVAVTPSGLLAVGEAPALGSVEGSVSIVGPEGDRRKSVPLARTPLTTPAVLDDGTMVVALEAGIHAFDSLGTTKLFVSKGISTAQPFGIFAPPKIWIARKSGVLLDLNLSGGGLGDQQAEGAAAAAGDGSLVVLTHRAGVGGVLLGLDPAGKQRWEVELEKTGADIDPPALLADGSVVVTLGSVVYVIGD